MNTAIDFLTYSLYISAALLVALGALGLAAGAVLWLIRLVRDWLADRRREDQLAAQWRLTHRSGTGRTVILPTASSSDPIDRSNEQ